MSELTQCVELRKKGRLTKTAIAVSYCFRANISLLLLIHIVNGRVVFQNALHAESVDLEEIKKFDPLAVDESQRMLEPPLRPLPAPMQPEILPSAKMACVRASMGMLYI